jgi:hypothetical protein
MNPILQALAQLLNDNMTNRITPALCDGLMMAMNQVILANEALPKKAAKPAAKEPAKPAKVEPK